ncbi:hypothetical protein [Micromonospora echinaurantiaca]|uniref:hypothetical protein n=1 Tax=Micromonospora echinaurantiaca TaxID=47857 RepID=UPI0034433F99
MTEIDKEVWICAVCDGICVEDAGRWVHPGPSSTLQSRRTCSDPHPSRIAKPREIKDGQARYPKEKYKIEQRLECLGPVEAADVAIVGYWRPNTGSPRQPKGCGYLASSGHYGCGATTTPSRFDGPGTLAAEARALIWAVRRMVPAYRTTLLTDRPEIAELIESWRGGNTAAVTPGYDSSDRPSGKEAQLTRTARQVYRYADTVSVQLVNGSADNVLTIGAHELSFIGWQWCAEVITKETARERALRKASSALGVEPRLAPGASQPDYR